MLGRKPIIKSHASRESAAKTDEMCGAEKKTKLESRLRPRTAARNNRRNMHEKGKFERHAGGEEIPRTKTWMCARAKTNSRATPEAKNGVKKTLKGVLGRKNKFESHA